MYMFIGEVLRSDVGFYYSLFSCPVTVIKPEALTRMSVLFKQGDIGVDNGTCVAWSVVDDSDISPVRHMSTVDI